MRSRACSKCRVDKPRSEFYPSEWKPTGWARCIDCARAAARAHYAANRERQAANARDRMRRARKEHPEVVRAREREYWARPENVARRSEQQARMRERQTFRDDARQRLRDWRAANPDHARAKGRLAAAARAARKHGLFVEHVDALLVLERHDGVCGICGEDVDPFDYHVDHTIPLARGGEHSYANTQPAHPFCNVSKGARLPEELPPR